MARLTKGTVFGLTTKEVSACRMLALGKSFDEVAIAVYAPHISELTESSQKKRMTAARKALRKWMSDPAFIEMYKQILKEYVLPAYGQAIGRITDQIQDENGWLANKAANDILTRFNEIVMGKEDKEIVVKVQGAPILGSPDPIEDTAPEAEEDGSAE